MGCLSSQEEGDRILMLLSVPAISTRLPALHPPDVTMIDKEAWMPPGKRLLSLVQLALSVPLHDVAVAVVAHLAMKGDTDTAPLPTVGFNVERIKYKGHWLNIYDIGGQV